MSLEEDVEEIGKELPFNEKTEMGEIFDNLDNDNISSNGFSKIDFNARLLGFEANNCVIFDEIKALGLLPFGANLTMQKKRISVSIGGLGRQEKVQIASASRGAELQGKSGGFLGSLFKPREPDGGMK